MDIEQETDSDLAHAKIGQQLRFMRRFDGFNRLDFQNDSPIHNNVSPKPEGEYLPIVNDRDGNLIFERNTSLHKLPA